MNQLQAQSAEPPTGRADALWQAVAAASALLSSAPGETFSATVFRALEGMRNAAGADASVIWKCQEGEAGRPVFPLFAAPASKMPKTIALDLDSLPLWSAALAAGKTVCSSRTAGNAEAEFVSTLGGRELTLIPILDQGGLWGLATFEQPKGAAPLDDTGIGALTTGSLLICQAVIRNELAVQAAEDRQAALESVQTKNAFFTHMSREIRSPMNIVVGMSAIAKNAGTDLEKIRECMGSIDGAARQLLEMLKNALDLSRLEIGKLELAQETFRLEDAVNRAYLLVREDAVSKGLDVRVQIRDSVPRWIVGDKERITQIITNLLTNAVIYTPAGGGIALEAGAVLSDKVVLTIAVADTGPGIPAGDRAHIFDAFYRADDGLLKFQQGSGLGLALCRELARAMKGDITLECPAQGGSRFTVHLTVGMGQALPPDPGEVQKTREYDFTGKTILLAEDMEINRMIVTSLLEPTGVRMEQAVNGEAALKMFASYPQHYDLIYMDMYMPVMDGLEATRRIRTLPVEHAKTVPIIAMTANVYEEDVQKCMEAGMNAHIAKPIDFDNLLGVTGQYLMPVKDRAGGKSSKE